MNRIEAGEWAADDVFSPWDSAAPPPSTRPAAAWPVRAPTAQLQHQPRRAGSGALALAAALAAQQGPRSTASAFDFSSDDPPPPWPASCPLAEQQPRQQPARADVAAQPQTAPPAAPALPAPPPQPPLPAPAAAAASLASPLSLERYLDLFQLLTKGRGVVQPPSELERSALRLGDLRAVVAGGSAASKGKREILDRLPGLGLFDPGCMVDAAPPPAGASDAMAPPSQQQQQQQRPAAPVPAQALASLAWAQPLAQGVAAAAAASAAYSCCPLAEVEVCLPAGAAAPRALAAARPAAAAAAAAASTTAPQPSDSEGATMGSAEAAAMRRRLALDSPGVEQQPRPSGAAAALATASELQQPQEEAAAARHPASPPESPGHEAPSEPAAWLVAGLARVGAASRGSAEVLRSPSQLLGRKVAFVSLEDFEQRHADGTVDTVAAGVQEGQVVEFISAEHDGCPPNCAEAHAHYYVRVCAHAPVEASPPGAAPRGRRLELALDLAPGLRRATLGELAGLDDAALEEAWVLLEPRLAAGGAGPGAEVGAGAEAGAGAGAEAGAGASQAAEAALASPTLPPVSAEGMSAGTPQQQQQAVEPPAKRARAAAGAGQLPGPAPPPLPPAAQLPRAPQPAVPAAAAPPAAALPNGSLVWASFAGTWWPGLLLAAAAPAGGGAGGAASRLQVEVFVSKGMRVLLPPASVSAFEEQREARTARLLRAQSDLGRRAVERAARLAAGG